MNIWPICHAEGNMKNEIQMSTVRFDSAATLLNFIDLEVILLILKKFKLS